MSQCIMVTNAQINVLKAVYNLINLKGISPTIKEIAKETNKAPNGSMEHVHRLCNKGLLKRMPGVSRSIQLTIDGEKALKRSGIINENSQSIGVENKGRELERRILALTSLDQRRVEKFISIIEKESEMTLDFV
ncbi:hypothetical protein A3715_19510 [Oleiphilus sp. HI0009]|nr:hypothetical protein A3715_19510 [Oleiphilus sp. HI0009]